MIKTAFFITTVLLAATNISQADVLSIIDADNAANSGQSIPSPKNGMSMAQVNQQFGEAEQTSSPVGEPVITVWTYPTFKVYFENSLVLYSVVTPK